jgi:small conductance mechanosensitive channel
MTHPLRWCLALLTALFWLAADVSSAQDAPTEAPAAEADAPADQTDTEAPPAEEAAPEFPEVLTDPDVPLNEFALRLIPLTEPELAALAEEWLAIVQERTEQVVEAQIGTLAEEEDAAAAARERLVALTENRDGAFEKYSFVLDSWLKKGGDPATIDGYRAYRSSIIVEETRAADFETLMAHAIDWATDRDGGIALALRVAVIVAAFLALLIVARVIRRIAGRGISRIPNLSRLLQAFLITVVYWLTIAIGLMVVLSALGIDITPVFALIGGASFIIAFAMQDTLGNLAAGLMIMINRPFDEGDYVDIGGVAGTVQSVSIVSTKVTTPDNQVIVVPNSKVWGNVITNVTASPTRRVDLVFGIGYDDSIEEAQRVLEEVVQAHPLILADPPPVIRVNALGTSSVDFVCRPWARSEDYWTVYWDLTRQVKERFDDAGISIPFPQTDMHVHIADGSDRRPPFLPSPGDAPAPASRPAGAPDYATGDEGHSEPDTGETNRS